MIKHSLSRFGLAIAAVGALGVTAAAPTVQAQAYDDGAYYQNGSDDELIIRAPYHQRYSSIGAPIERVAISRRVFYRDLDLRTAWGARELRARIYDAAYSACNQMDTFYPISASNEPNPDVDSCTHAAVRDAMPQAYSAINYAREYSSR